MNDANFAGMAIGNHEFDWKTDYISLNRELSNFPFLAANIFEKATGELASFVETSTIITRNGVKIGLIGTVGNGLESSIFMKMLRTTNLEFLITISSKKVKTPQKRRGYCNFANS